MPRRTMKAGRKGTKKRKRSRRRRGGSVLVNAAVPASLIYALNKKYGKKKFQKLATKGRKRRSKNG